jgi:hypothetical protein
MRPLTKEEGIVLLDQWADNEINRSQGLWQKRRHIVVHLTRILEPYEKSANYPLPEYIEQRTFKMNQTGIQTLNGKIDWSDVCVCGIAVEELGINRFEEPEFNYRLLVVLHTMVIKQFTVYHFEQYKGLLGHFIELYRLNER